MLALQCSHTFAVTSARNTAYGRENRRYGILHIDAVRICDVSIVCMFISYPISANLADDCPLDAKESVKRKLSLREIGGLPTTYQFPCWHVKEWSGVEFIYGTV